MATAAPSPEPAATWEPIDTLVPWASNPRNNASAVGAVVESIRRYGWGAPIVARRADGMVIAGHTRLLAAAQLGLASVPVRYLDVSARDAELLALADNRIGEIATWDDAQLRDVLAGLADHASGLEDLALAGWQEQDVLGLLPSEPLPDTAGPGLAHDFGAPPFSVLDARQGYWQERKRQWLALGVNAAAGRVGLGDTNCNADLRKLKHRLDGHGIAADQGGSSFDPVLAELLMRWFTPGAGATVLDPFAGEAVKGVVAGALGYQYTGVEVRERQVLANRRQWTLIADNCGDISFEEASPPGRDMSLETKSDPTRLSGGPTADQGRGTGHRLRVVHGPQGPLVDEAVRVFNGVTCLPPVKGWSDVAPGVGAWLAPLYVDLGAELDCNLVDPGPVGQVEDNGTMWILYSGGKDGAASALLARAEGLEPVLYHVHGINRAYPRELKWVRRFAAATGIRLIVDRVKVTGKEAAIKESPFKNMALMSMMVSRMMEEGGARYGSGCHPLVNDGGNAGINWSDGMEAIATWDKRLCGAVDGLQPHRYMLKNDVHSLAVIADAGLLDQVHGCLLPARRFKRVRDANERKHGPLLDGRCGSCMKCVREWIMLHRLGVPQGETDAPGRWAHCRKLLHKSMVEIHGGSPDEDPEAFYIDAPTVDAMRRDVWPLPVVEGVAPAAPGGNVAPLWVHGDSAALDDCLPAGAEYDLVFTSPPYFDLEVYSADAEDGSAKRSYADFMAWYEIVFAQAVARLKDNRFLAVKVGDVRDKRGAYHGFVADNVDMFQRLGLHLYNEAVLVTMIGTMPLRAGRAMRAARKLCRGHQLVLIFYKGDPRQVGASFPKDMPAHAEISSEDS